MQSELKKKKSVLGIRLSYLSKIPDVRSAIQDQMQSRNLMQLMHPLRVGYIDIDARDDEKEEFASKLDQLAPGLGLGDEYLAEPEVINHDKRERREHDWDWWQDAVKDDNLGDQLHRAVERILGYGLEVDTYGMYEAPETAVHDYDSGRPRLEFRTPKRYGVDPSEKA